MKCQTLKDANKTFLESLKSVDKAHAIGILEGYELNPCVDYHVLEQLCRKGGESPYPTLVSKHGDNPEGGITPAGPSMSTFYENLGRIFRGEWWFFSDTSMDAYCDKLDGVCGADFHLIDMKKDINYFAHLCYCLAFDIFGFAAELTQGDDSGRDEIFGLFKLSSWIEKNPLDENAALMPVERFMYLYARFSFFEEFRGMDSDTVGPRVAMRNNTKAAMKRFFCENYHK